MDFSAILLPCFVCIYVSAVSALIGLLGSFLRAEVAETGRNADA